MLISKKIIQLLKIFLFSVDNVLSDAQERIFRKVKSNFLNLENDKNWKFLKMGFRVAVKSSAAIKIILVR